MCVRMDLCILLYTSLSTTDRSLALGQVVDAVDQRAIVVEGIYYCGCRN